MLPGSFFKQKMNNSRQLNNLFKTNLVVIALFLVMTIFMTYPVILKMGSSVRDRGDPLLNTWILASNVNKIVSLEIHNFFDTNIFYPHKKTLAYSEHMFTQSLIALPVALLVNNPIFVYNFVLLFSFFSSGLGMYYLCRYLTQNSFGAIIAGAIYAFSPFMISHLSHLQILTAGGIPLIFLYLHKFFKDERTKHLCLFSLFFLLQVLANGYYAMYLFLYVGILFVLFVILKKKLKDWHFWLKITILFLVVLILSGPFFAQYIYVKKEMGFSRKIGSYAKLSSFLSTHPDNRVYGKLTLPLWEPERQLFPGLIAFLLAMSGIIFYSKKTKKKIPLIENPVLIYSGILLLSFLFILGPNGPYIFLYKYVPGFDGLRAVPRFHIFIMFSLAVLAAFGVKGIGRRVFRRRSHSPILSVVLFLLILLEYTSIPISLKAVPIKEEIPGVYKWLAQNPDVQNILELPLPKPKDRIERHEAPRLYYSTYHWKNMLNGYSGYISPLYNELRRRWQSNPIGQNLEDIQTLCIDHVLIHSNYYKAQDLENVLRHFEQEKDLVQFVTEIEGAYIYKLKDVSEEKGEFKANLKPLPKTNWTAHANKKRQKAKYAIDGNIQTRWETGHQKMGDYFELDLGQVHPVGGISFKLGDKPHDYPRGYRIELSLDGQTWTEVIEKKLTRLPIKALLKPKDLSVYIHIPRQDVRYVRITNTGKHEVYYWSIFEIEVLY
jgi:hypothetical protein